MRLIQIGAGNMGKWWMQVVSASDVVELAAVVDVDRQRASDLLNDHELDSIPVFETLEAALHDMQADAVLDVSPPQFRPEHIRLAIEHGLPLLIEKPLASSMQEAHTILDMVEQQHLVMVAQDYRYHTPIQTAKSVLDRGVIGRLSKVTVEHYRGLHLPGFHQQLAYPLLQDMSIHHFDLMRFFLNSEPESMYARSWNPPGSRFNGDAAVAAIFDFPHDVTVTYNASWSSNGLITPWNGNWRFEGEAGVLTLRDDVVMLQKPNGIEGLNFTFDEAVTVEPVEGLLSGQHYLLDEFYEAAQATRIPATRVQDNIHSFRMVFKVIESVENGAVVAF